MGYKTRFSFRVSHLILGVDSVYSTWQAFSQALLVDSPLLSYINVWHENFLPPKFTIGKTHDLGPHYTCLNELAPIQDESVERMSQRRREQVHKLIQQEAPLQPKVGVEPEAPFEPEAPTQVEETTIESVSSSETKSNMVTKKVMTISRFVPGARPTAQQQEPQGQGQTPPPPPHPPPKASSLDKNERGVHLPTYSRMATYVSNGR